MNTSPHGGGPEEELVDPATSAALKRKRELGEKVLPNKRFFGAMLVGTLDKFEKGVGQNQVGEGRQSGC